MISLVSSNWTRDTPAQLLDEQTVVWFPYHEPAYFLTTLIIPIQCGVQSICGLVALPQLYHHTLQTCIFQQCFLSCHLFFQLRVRKRPMLGCDEVLSSQGKIWLSRRGVFLLLSISKLKLTWLWYYSLSFFISSVVFCYWTTELVINLYTQVVSGSYISCEVEKGKEICFWKTTYLKRLFNEEHRFRK